MARGSSATAWLWHKVEQISSSTLVLSSAASTVLGGSDRSVPGQAFDMTLVAKCEKQRRQRCSRRGAAACSSPAQPFTSL